MRRLFVAVTVPEPVRRHLSLLAGGIPGARWVAADNLHITLRFIGEVDGALEQDIVDALAGLHQPGFDIRLEGVGQFGSATSVRSLWAGVAPCPELLQLHRAVHRAVSLAAALADRRRFLPHVTLARLKGAGPQTVAGWLGAQAQFRSTAFRVTEFVLFDSRLGRKAAHYTPVVEFPLLER
ncbi:MAG: RNA 2',3'-cyclic phosphodiesterase [Alphaproteobacteria bacterium]|nr:RNA 2',3'-cyclic phosphodiesterase [Alphaproteobacteria bacterium]